MNPTDLLLRLRELDVRIRVEDGQLRFSPEDALPQELRDDLDAHQAELIRFLREVSPGAAAPRATGVHPVPREGSLPVSFAQQRFWFLSQLGEENAAYHLMLALRLRGDLDTDALAQALGDLWRRHEALRTTFRVVDGAPVQVVAEASAGLAVARVDLRAETDPGAAAQRLAHEEFARPFDLVAGPLFRATLLQVGPREHWLLATTHHAVSDRWSYGILCDELAALYAARRRGVPPPLAPLRVQYADFAAWQQRWYAEHADELVDYWRRQLAGAPLLELPIDRPRPPAQTFRGAKVVLPLPRELNDRLKAIARAESCTFFMAMLAAFDVLLARWSDQDDIVVGTPVANRHEIETETMVGPFLNSLVLRVDLSGRPSFRELLARVREVALGADQHQQMPFEQLVVELAPQRDLSRNPLFQVMFNVLTEAPALQLEGVDVEPLELGTAAANVDLSLVLDEHADGAADAVLQYNRDLFDAATVERMAEQLRALLEALARAPDRDVFAHEILTEDERRLLRGAAARAGAAPERCFVELFEQQAAREPARLAVRSGASALSYGELDARAEQLACRLRARGARPGVLVGLCVERSVEMLVALLAIAKTGAAYVPLDPAHPPARLAFILRDARAELLVTERRMRDALPAELPAAILLDAGDEAPAAVPPDAPVRPPRPGDLAYVIYTSGSTGQPKGVQVEHRALANLLASMAEQPGMGKDDVLAAVTTISFDIAGLELLLPLIVGGQVVVVPREVAADGPRLAALLADCGATVLQATPATWRLLLEAGWPGAPRLKALCGGEALPRELAEQLLPRCAALWNVYGPTETTIWSLAQRVASGSGPVPIGVPIAHTDACVLDRRGQLCPVGVPGELHLGGAGLARGYRGRPDLTAEKFVPHPFAEGPGARLYATGDLARVRADGTFEFLGRRDHQVKIRGFRIELGEVEHVLGAHPAVAACAVVVQASPSGEPTLAAHVVLEPGAAASAAELQAALRRALPDYMVPAAFALRDALPLSPAGKVDRNQLAAEGSARAHAADYVPPRTSTERLIADIWRGVLGVERAGLRDNFFELGGHSLLAMRAVFRLEQATAARFSPMELLTVDLEQLARACDERRASTPAAAAIERAPEGGPLPLSFAQERFWLLAQIEQDAAAYNVPLVLRLRGPLDAAALQASLAEIVRRHDALRARFARDGESLSVALADPGPIELRTADVSSAADPFAAAGARARDELAEPFDLGAGPLFRFLLLRLNAGDHVLAITLHHAVADEWSLGVLCRELAALYAAHADGRTAALPTPALRYVDHAHAQRQRYAQTAARHLAYWKDRLDGLTTLALPTDRPRPAAQTFRGRCAAFTVPAPLAARLLELGRQQGCTPFMTMLAAFDVLLARYTGQDDIAVGTPVANREPRTEQSIGLFLNTVVLRSDLSGEPGFRALLQRVRTVAVDAFAHAEMPFEQLVAAMQPERDPSRSPLFQVLFQANEPARAFAVGPLRAEPLAPDGVSAKFDLTFGFADTGSGLQASFEYNTDLFDDATVARMQRHFLRLLEAITSEPDRPVHDLPLLADEELQMLRAGAAHATRAAAPSRCFHEMIAARTAVAPDAVAVVCGGDVLTHAELDARANRLAHHLRALGAGPGMLVGICLERSAEMVVALIGIARTGAAYVPLDPAHPPDRLAFIAADADLQLLVTQEHLRAALPAHGARLVCVDTDAAQIAERSAAPLPPLATPDDVAYVLYTSGSTGRPKGVQVEHRALANLLASIAERPGMVEGDVLAAVSTISFDIAELELLLPPLVGGRTVIVPREIAADGARLAALLAECGATVLQATPASWRLLVEAGWQGAPRLRAFCGGEAMPRELAEQLLSRCAAVFNMYGPTETTIYSVVHRVASGSGPVPIGTPVAHTDCYVLDRRGELCPLGVPGELHIGGAGLARGYLGRPDLTAEKFVPHPFATEPGARLYATGDLARVRADGTIEFLGRRDHQVKIRGFRIELGEIEHVLGAHPAVAACAVVVQPSPSGEPGLAAHVVLEPGAAASAADLQAALRRELPDYMVPAAFATWDALPLSPSGKIDRRALARSAAAQALARGAHEPPRGEIECAVADVWQSVLGIERPGRRDSFFDLGGHSLLALRVAGRLKQRLGLDVSVRAILEFPALADFAAALPARRDAPLAVPIGRAPREAPLPLSFAQERFWFLAQIEQDFAAYNVQAALRLRGPLDVGALQGSLAAVVRRHELLRTRFAIVGEGPMQVVVDDASPELPVTDISTHGDPVAEAVRTLSADEQRPFDVAAAPPLAWRLLRLAPDDHVFAVTAHHMTWDQWSLGVLCRELRETYEACTRGDEPSLPELPVQYGDFAVWQRRWYEKESAGALAYWKARLAALPTVDLPTDHPRPPLQTFRGAIERFAVGECVAARLGALGREMGCTLFMTVLAAFKTLLARHTQQQDLVVGVPAGKRDIAELVPLIGPLLNTLVLRTDISGDPTFRELLQRVRAVALGAYEHQDLPFERLVAELRPPRDVSRTPLFQILFQSHELPETFALGPVAAEPFGIDRVSAKFDLTVGYADTGSGLVGAIEYNVDLFEPLTVARMARHFERLLEECAADPDRCIWELPMLADGERRALLADVNRTARDYPRDRCFHELFEANAAAHGDRPALVCGSTRLAYGELNARANRLARRLRALGAAPGARVGLCVERSAEMLVALLAIMKSGAAYVPLDPGHPPERLAFVIDDAGIELLVTQERLRAALPRELPHVVCVERAGAGLGEHDPSDLGRLADPDDVAYVIFTSGSTGRPKGVEIQHRALVNFLCSMAAEPGMTADDVLAAVTTVSFDIAGLELWLPLLVGGVVVIAESGVEADGGAIAALLGRSGATVMQATPATWHLLVASGWQGNPRLRILCGGEALSRELAEQLLPRCRALWNMYGPTETTIWSLAHRVGSGAGPVPIGGCIANTEIYLLGRRGEPVPYGVPGRLHIGGDGLARGYWNRPQLTAEKFSPHPFAARPGARLYETGDLARRRVDGTLEFLGRADDQVKVRGYRIELGEIEAALQDSPAVDRAVVTVRRLDDGDARLVAHVVLRPGEPRGQDGADERATVAELRERLRARLPSYMLPSQVHVVEALPLTPSGKVDRKALASADAARPDVAAVEEALREHPAVKECAAVRDADTRLAAHIVFWPKATATVSELRGFLRDKVPAQMVPRTFVMRDELPRTADGGIDLHALRPNGHADRTEDAALAPRTPMEQIIARVWREVLRVDRVGVRDNFFDLGGHSLLATRVALRVEREIGQRVSPMDLLVQDLGQFARHCEKRAAKPDDGDKDGTRASLLGRIKNMFARNERAK